MPPPRDRLSAVELLAIPLMRNELGDANLDLPIGSYIMNKRLNFIYDEIRVGNVRHGPMVTLIASAPGGCQDAEQEFDL
jgi:hypothetical protein